MRQTRSMQRRPSALRATISWTILPKRGRLAGAISRIEYHAGRRDPRGPHGDCPQNFSGVRMLAGGILRGVLDIGLRAVAAGGGLGVPLAVGGFVFDGFGAPGHPLLGGRALGCSERRGMRRERFREHAVNGISPSAIMLDDLVGDMGHRGTRWFR